MRKLKWAYLLWLASGLLKAGFLQGQDHPGFYVESERPNCKVWFKHIFTEDSVTWTGGCLNGFAHGNGTWIGYTQGRQSSQYTGEILNGKPNGMGIYSFRGSRKLEGNFKDGEPLFLSENLLNHLHKNTLSELDSSGVYHGDNGVEQIYYHCIVPKEVKGCIVLMPGTWETTEHLLSSMNSFCALAFQNDLAVLVPSINQRLTLTTETLYWMNAMFSHAIGKYKIPKDKFVLGGWSMGGIFSMRYAEFAMENSAATVIKPIAVFNCDGPTDLETIYHNFKRKLHKNPGQNEPAYGLREFEKYCGGSPETSGNMYEYYSPFSRNREDGGNARYLIGIPVRIYADVDPVWWMQNRHVDMYDLNCLDQSAMIQWLNDNGNPKAEFINAFQKGYRLEGNRHPHSWSIIDAEDCIQWILKCLHG